MTIYITYENFTNKNLGRIKNASRILAEANVSGETLVISEEEIPQEEIWIYHPMIQENREILSMEKLLLDERYAEGYLNIPIAAFEKYGYINEKLPAKRRYELLLRFAEHYIIRGIKICAAFEVSKMEEAGAYAADCYIAGKYSGLLREAGYFEAVVQALLKQTENSDDRMQRLQYLEDMIAHGEAYWKIADGTAPILIYYGVTYCYNIMNVMLQQLAKALRETGEQVIVYDEQAEDVIGLSKFVGQRFKAVIGIQTYLMSVYMKKSDYFLHDRIIGPKFNMILDHPVWLKSQLEQVPKNYYVLTHDENYRCFVEKYYSNVEKAYLFAPAGVKPDSMAFGEVRRYELSFVGTYGDYRKKCEVIYQSKPKIRYLANRFLLYLRRYTELTAEAALEKTLEYYGIQLEKEEFFQLLYEMRSVVQCVMYYYREKVIETLVRAKIKVHIWGDSWKASPIASSPYLEIHKEVYPEESLKILSQSIISLNVMAWHKGGFTERMANVMLSGAVLLTDETTYCPKELKAGENCVMFSLKELAKLPEKVMELFQNGKLRQQIAENGCQYAQKYHTWEQRAEQLLQIIGEVR